MRETAFSPLVAYSILVFSTRTTKRSFHRNELGKVVGRKNKQPHSPTLCPAVETKNLDFQHPNGGNVLCSLPFLERMQSRAGKHRRLDRRVKTQVPIRHRRRIRNDRPDHSFTGNLTASASVNGRITRHGLPAAKTFSGISRVTTLPAPIMEPDPMETPGLTMTPAPNQTSLPTVTGNSLSHSSGREPSEKDS